LELDSVDQSSVQGDVLVLRGKAQHFLNLQRLKFKPGAFGEIRAKAKDIRDVVFENAKPKRGVMPPVSLTRDQRQELRDLFKAWQALKYPKKLWLEGLLDRKTDPIILAQFFMFALMDEDFEVRRRVVELNNGIPTFYRGQVLLPVDFLLQHVERPWLSIDLYTSIMGKRPFTPEKEREALRDKRLALLVLFLVEFRRRYAFKRTEPELIAYLDEIKNHLASPISTQGLLKASGQAKLYVEQAVEDHRISLFGDRSPLSFWEVFLIERARDRVLTKMFPGKLTTYHFVQEKYVPLLLNADIVSWSEPDFSHLLVSTVSAIDHEVADMHIPVVTPDIDHLPSVHRGDEITINIVYKPISKGLIFHAKANDWQSPLSEEHNFPYLTSEQRQKATKDHNQVYNIPLTQISSSKYTISLRAGLEREMNFVILDNGEGISGFNHILHVLPLADTAMTTRAEAEFVKPNAAMLRNDDNQSLYGLNGEQLIAWFGRNMRRLEILGLDHHTILTRITQRLQTALLEGEISTGTFRQHFFRYQDLLIPAFPFDLSGQIEKDKIKSPEGLPAIAAQMTQNHGGKVQVIGMAGEGGAGKTATAETLAQFLIKKGLRVGVVGLDGYFKPRELRHQQNLIGMAQIDMSRLAGDVQNFKNGKKFYPPLYIPRTGQYVASPDPIDPAKIDVLIFDGNWTFILEPLKELLTYKVYVDWPVRDRFRYLIERNMSVRKYSREYAVWQAVNSLIKERSLIRKQAKMADIIIQNQAMITADKSMTDIDQMFEDEDLRLSSTDIRFLKTIHGTVVAGKNNKRYRFDYGFGNSAFMKRFITTHKLDVFIIKEIDGNGNVIPVREKVGSVSIFPLDQGRYSDGLRLGFLHFDLYDNNDIRQGIFSGFLQKLHTEYLKVETIKEENTLVYMAERFLLKGTIAQIMESKPQDRPRIFAKKLSVFKVSVLNEAFKNSPMGQALVKAGFHEFHVIFGKEGMEMHVEAWINKAMSADDNLAMRSKIQKTGGIDLTSDQGLSIQNQGQAVKFYIDPSKLAELQNTPGFVPIIINVQPVTDLRLWLGITSAK
jgi:uridine kinase